MSPARLQDVGYLLYPGISGKERQGPPIPTELQVAEEKLKRQIEAHPELSGLVDAMLKVIDIRIDIMQREMRSATDPRLMQDAALSAIASAFRDPRGGR